MELSTPVRPALQIPPPELTERFIAHIRRGFAGWIDPSQQHFQDQLGFAEGRLHEGLELVDFFTAGGLPPEARVLDIGAGNGGVILPFANAGYRSVALDIVPNHDLIALRRDLQLPLEAIVAGGDGLPFRNDSFDLVLLLDVIEHVGERSALGREVMRVLRPGGRCMITTPARLRHILGRDPHFNVPGILVFPNAVQRFIVNHIFRRRVRSATGQQVPAYDVEHIFWSVDEVTHLFPGAESHDVLFNALLHPSRFPRRAWWHYRLRGYFWDRIIIRKA